MEGQAEPAVADPQLQSLGRRAELRGQQQPVRVPRPELEAGGEAPGGRGRRRRRRRRQRQEAAAGAQEGAGRQLGLRAREGHVALEDDRGAEGFRAGGASGGVLERLHWSHVSVRMTGGGEEGGGGDTLKVIG